MAYDVVLNKDGSGELSLSPEMIGFGKIAATVPATFDIASYRSDFVVLLRRQGQLTICNSLLTKLGATPLQCWIDLANQINSICLGLVYEAGSDSNSIGEIIAEGLVYGALPGAIAVMGYDPSLLIMLEQLVLRSHQPANRSVSSTAPNCIPFEWPAIAFFLVPDDPHLLDCARACRSLEAAGVPAQLEIISPGEDAEGRSTRLSDERDRFFHKHLATYFPKMFQPLDKFGGL